MWKGKFDEADLLACLDYIFYNITELFHLYKVEKEHKGA
jgi:hypothetical protein